MPSQTGSIDLTSQTSAAQTATNYITADANGISIHMANESNTYQRQTSNSTTFYVGGKKRSQVGADGLHVYVDMAETEVAKFTSAGAQIGKSGESHILQDYHSLQMIDKEGITYFKVEDLCDESGTLEVTDTFESDGESKVYVLTYTATGTDYTVTVSDDSGGSVQKQTTKITFNTYPTVGAVITVTYTTASELTKSYTFGKRKANADVGAMSVADGLDTAASGRQSHASGYLTTASGSNSYAGGARTTAAGRNSRATGEDTTANGWGSNADGLQTIAGYNYQTVIGKWNENHYNNAFEIGNGVTGARSNAFVVDWDGNIIAQGMAGIIQMFAGATPPTGWLVCDGSAISRTTYATLFAAIGTTWGAGDGSTTFNIPDLRGRAPIGAGTGTNLTARTLGGKLGEETHALTAGETGLRAHTHSFTQPTVKVKYSKAVASGSATNHIDGSSSSSTAAPMEVSGGAVGAVTGGEKSGSAHNNMQPSAVVNFIICTGKTS